MLCWPFLWPAYCWEFLQTPFPSKFGPLAIFSASIITVNLQCYVISAHVLDINGPTKNFCFGKVIWPLSSIIFVEKVWAIPDIQSYFALDAYFESYTEHIYTVAKESVDVMTFIQIWSQSW